MGTLAAREPGVNPLYKSLGDFADRLQWKLALNALGAAGRVWYSISCCGEEELGVVIRRLRSMDQSRKPYKRRVLDE